MHTESGRGRKKAREPDLGILASRILFGVQREMFGRLNSAGHPNVRPRHGAVLAYINVEGTRATDLANQSGQHKQVIGNLVDELVELGYVTRQPDPSDRRAKLVVPTELGLDEMKRSDAIVEEIEARCAALMPDVDFKAIKQSLALIADVLHSK